MPVHTKKMKPAAVIPYLSHLGILSNHSGATIANRLRAIPATSPKLIAESPFGTPNASATRAPSAYPPSYADSETSVESEGLEYGLPVHRFAGREMVRCGNSSCGGCYIIPDPSACICVYPLPSSAVDSFFLACRATSPQRRPMPGAIAASRPTIGACTIGQNHCAVVLVEFAALDARRLFSFLHGLGSAP